MKALLLVDVQNDFLPGGRLAVPRGDEVVDVANRLMDSNEYNFVFATQDWHPENHGSFATQYPGKRVGETVELAGQHQLLWPEHCVQGSDGADFPVELRADRIDEVIRKGMDCDVDSYSGFFDNGKRKATGLADLLRKRGVREVHVMGLATDYCVKFTALDARLCGFDVTLVSEGVRGVDVNAGDCDRAVREMKEFGVDVR